MNKIVFNLKKFTLIVLIRALTLVAIPMSSASYAGLTTDDTPLKNSADRTLRLASIWDHLKNVCDHQGLFWIAQHIS